MDFWARLVKGGSPSKKPIPPANSPQVRVAHLKRAYNSLLVPQIWHNGDGVSEDPFVIKNVCICLQRIAELLRDDQRSPTPHLCVSFAATSRILVTVVRISTAFQAEPITQETLRICQLLIDSEEEAFLEDRGFANTLPQFVESAQRLSRISGNEEIEASLVEILFGITAKVRVESHLLRVWFRPEKPEEDEEELTEEERRTSWEEFPLFYILLNYVPSEGRAGEFSRMGLVYIVEIATVSSDLEKWLVEGDVAALMASGLGALYSQLSRSVRESSAFHYRSEEIPAILTFSERLNIPASADIESTISETYQTHLGTFLMSLKFWQDLIEHCRSEDVKQTLLDHFRYLFLHQLLYPSLVESSDMEGGSSVAVLTYLKHILEHIDHPDLVRITLQYLFGIQNSANSIAPPKTALSRARSRKSADLLTRLKDEDQPTPELFNLSALIFTSLGSKSQQTITATLQILSVMLRGSHHQSLTSLLRTRPVLISDEKRTIGAHEKEIEKLLSLAEELTGFQDLETSYEQHIHDSRNNLETHLCTIELLNLPVGNKTSIALESGKALFSHKILMLEDATFTNLIILLDDFFNNDIETNLGLTQVLIDLASCGYLRLEGWLLSSPSSYTYSNQMDSVLDTDRSLKEGISEARLSSDQSRQMKLARLQPNIPSDHISPIVQSLTRLTKAVSAFRHSITNFESHLSTCRGIVDLPSRYPTPMQTPSRSPSRLNALYGTSPGRFEQPSTGTPAPITISSKIITSTSSTRNVSPRGRQENKLPELGTPPSLVSRLGQLQLSPTRKSIPSSAENTPSRSPLRANNHTSTVHTVPVIPAALWQRIHVDKRTANRSNSNLGSEPSDTDSDASSLGPDLDELSPVFATETPSKSRHIIAPSKSRKATGVRDPSQLGRQGRDGNTVRHSTAIDSDDSDENGEKNKNDSDNTEGSQATQSGRRTEHISDGTVSLGHLLSNVIVLQEFTLEIASVIEVRGALFEELQLF